MSEFKGTKGKWKVIPAKHIGCTLVYLGEFKGDIEIWHHHGETSTKEEAEANAKLISHAPELLEMVKLLVDRLEENGFEKFNAVSRAK